MHDKFAVGYAGDVARHNHTRNNRAGKFKDMAEPEVDGRLMVIRESQPLACFLYNRRRETRTAERGQQAEKGRHNSQSDAVAGKNFLQRMNHAGERTAGAQLDFEAHNKVKRKNYVIGARQAQRFGEGLRQVVQLRRFHEPDKKSACQHTGADGDVTPQHQDNNRHGDNEQSKNIHRLLPF